MRTLLVVAAAIELLVAAVTLAAGEWWFDGWFLWPWWAYATFAVVAAVAAAKEQPR